jgi:hypothetical protein
MSSIEHKTLFLNDGKTIYYGEYELIDHNAEKYGFSIEELTDLLNQTNISFNIDDEYLNITCPCYSAKSLGKENKPTPSFELKFVECKKAVERNKEFQMKIIYDSYEVFNNILRDNCLVINRFKIIKVDDDIIIIAAVKYNKKYYDQVNLGRQLFYNKKNYQYININEIYKITDLSSYYIVNKLNIWFYLERKPILETPTI